MLKRLRVLGLFVVLLVLWQFVSLYVLDKRTAVLLPAPTEVLKAFWQLLVSGDLLIHMRDSLKRECVAFIWALSAVPLGIAMGWSKAIDEQVDPLVEVLRPVPPLAWIPLSILWFGIGDIQNQFIIFLGMFFPILLNTISGVKNIEPNLLRAARCLGAKEGRVLRARRPAGGSAADHHRRSRRPRRRLDGAGGGRTGRRQLRARLPDQ